MLRKHSLEHTAEKRLTYIGGIFLSQEKCVNNSLPSPFSLKLSVKSAAADTREVVCEKQASPAVTFLEFPQTLNSFVKRF